MSTFTFKGFTTGSAVALAAAQGAVGETASVPSWGQGASGNVEIQTIAPTSLAAPSAVWFEAINTSGFNVADGPAPGETYDPSFHEITYIWTVRGKPLTAFTAPENMVDGWNDPNLAYGKKVAFLFNDPGSYTVDLWAVDPTGATAIAEASVTVADPDVLYSGSNTVCVSLNGGWAGEKPGCQRVTSLAGLESTLNSASAPMRVLFKRGQTVPDVELLIGNSNVRYFGAWGSGAKPILRPTHGQHILRFSNSVPMEEFTVTDIAFLGGWDPASETGLNDRSPFSFLPSPADCHYTIANCAFSGFAGIWLGTGTDHPSNMAFANNTVTNWQDYGLFIHNTFDDTVRLAIIGCKIAQNVNGLNGGPKNGFYNNHGPVRCADAANLYIAMTDLFSRNGWSPLAPDTADQPCLRYNHLGTIGRSCIMDRCVCEGGFHPLAFAGQNNNTVENPGNTVIDKALLIGTAKTSKAFIVSEFGGMTVRNVLGIMPNAQAYHGIAWRGGVVYEVNNPNAANIGTPMAVYGSTFYSLRNTANDNGHDWVTDWGASVFDDVTVENNVLHAPGLQTPVTGDAPVNTSAQIAGVQTRYRGVLYNFDTESGTLGSAVPNGGSFTLPYPAGTNRAYWQAIEATDTQHKIRVGQFYHAELGQMTVTFLSSNVRITNTSGQTWTNGTDWILRLDRKSMLPGLDPVYNSPLALSYPVVQSGSQGFETADLGYQAHDDFFGTVRQSPTSAGAIEP